MGVEGEEWVVRRRWAPRLGAETLWARFRRRLRSAFRKTADLGDGLDAAEGCLAFEDVVVVVGLVVVVLLAVFFVIPLLVALVDVLVLLVIAGLGVVGRIVFRRPWVVEARSSGGGVLRWRVVGWRASREFRGRAAESLGAGVVPAGAETIGG